MRDLAGSNWTEIRTLAAFGAGGGREDIAEVIREGLKLRHWISKRSESEVGGEGRKSQEPPFGCRPNGMDSVVLGH